jgi:hypothetical protein
MKYLTGYPENLTTQVRQLLEQGRLGEVLLAKYPQAHGVRTDKALYEYVMGLKNDFLRHPVQRRAGGVFADDHSPRAGAHQGEGA